VDVRGSKSFLCGFQAWVRGAGVVADPQQSAAINALEDAWAARPTHAQAVAKWNSAVAALEAAHAARVREHEKRT